MAEKKNRYARGAKVFGVRNVKKKRRRRVSGRETKQEGRREPCNWTPARRFDSLFDGGKKKKKKQKQKKKKNDKSKKKNLEETDDNRSGGEIKP